MRIRDLFLASLLLLTPGVQAKEQAVEPGQRFTGPIINIGAPHSEGWKLMESSGNAVTFGRSGASSGESFIAAVLRFSLPEAQSKDEFVALIERNVEDDAPPERFTNIESTFEYSDQRGYPCVLYKAIGEDTKAKISFFGRRQLILQIRALYCRLPNMEKTGFAAMFSHRGATKVDDLDAQATDFIDGVQIPDSEPNSRVERPHEP